MAFQFVDLGRDADKSVIHESVNVHFNRTFKGDNVTVSNTPSGTVYEMPASRLEAFSGVKFDDRLLGGRVIMNENDFIDMIDHPDIKVYF